MKTVVVLFRLKANVTVADYQHWARTTDLPVVRRLPSVARFDVLRVTGLYGSADRPPYDYVELIDVRDLGDFGRDVSTETMRKVAAAFREFAEAPIFMVTDQLGEVSTNV